MTCKQNAIIWDMDGVLIDSGDLHYEAWHKVAADIGIDLTREYFNELFGMDNETAIRTLLDYEPTQDEIDRIASQEDNMYRVLAADRIQPILGAFEQVRAFAEAGWAQAVATSAPRITMEMILNKFELNEWFPVAVCVDEVPRGKPDPAVFELAAARLHIPPERCVIIEDSTSGVKAAKAAGMTCIALTTTRERDMLNAADRVIDELSSLTPEGLAALLDNR